MTLFKLQYAVSWGTTKYQHQSNNDQEDYIEALCGHLKYNNIIAVILTC